MKEQLILVNTEDQVLGYGEKMDVHRRGLLHRAFSILVYNRRGDMLLQKRAQVKYHSAGLWSNACCSHPVKGQDFKETLHGRLRAEMGFDCELDFAFSFVYKAALQNGLTEYELDHVYTGCYDGEVVPDPAEVSDFKWAAMNELIEAAERHPEQYTHWFRLLIEKVR